MKNRNIIKINLIIIVMTIFYIFSFNTYTVKAGGMSEVISSGSSFISEGKQELQQDGSGAFSQTDTQKSIKNIYNILLLVAIVVAIVIGMIIGMQLIVGSVEQKAKQKELIIPYVVGCMVIFGAFGIWKLVVDILQGMEG